MCRVTMAERLHMKTYTRQGDIQTMCAAPHPPCAPLTWWFEAKPADWKPPMASVAVSRATASPIPRVCGSVWAWARYNRHTAAGDREGTRRGRGRGRGLWGVCQVKWNKHGVCV